jgi:GT2 family glycosyltransferase
MFFSLIIPTFRRPEEVIECLESLTKQSDQSFEVIIADGTPEGSLEPQVAHFASQLSLIFLYEQYLGVSEARNLGAQHAKGDYLIFLDSDCIIPGDYISKLNQLLPERGWDEFGGPDAAHDSFTDLQKAISFTMTSILTTGGIRGNKAHVGQFHPRGFNMGMRKSVFEAVHGYSTFKCGEDIELSIRIIKAGYKVGLIPEAFVYHKRRTSIKQFYRQVFRFGAARINIWSRHREELKLTHLFPTLFILSLMSSVLLGITGAALAYFYLPAVCLAIPALFFLLYFIVLSISSTLQNKSLKVGLLSVETCVVQMAGYGFGFLANAWTVIIKGQKEGMKL